jgi:glutathionyl-hydroquinone reductase
MTFLTYKRQEANLQERLPESKISIEPIDGADLLYTDGEASQFTFKIIIDRFDTVYMPQMKCNISDKYKKIIKEWMTYVEKQQG